VEDLSFVKKKFSYPPSKKEYKENIYALNGETLFSALYQQVIDGEVIRILEPYSILQVAESKTHNIEEAVPATLEYTIRKAQHLIPLYAILKIKQKVLFYENDIEELKKMPVSELGKRLYLITKFEDGRISFRHHLNAMPEDELKNYMKKKGLADVGVSYFDFDDPIPKLRLSKSAFNFAIENKYFNIMPDGSINWK
jgi:hypothetical protein